MSSAVMGLLAAATIAGPSYILTQSTTSMNEGDTITFSLQVYNVDAGTTLNWDFVGAVVQDDFTTASNALSGSFNTTGSSNADVFLTLISKKDYNLGAEGTETFYIRLKNNSGVVLKTSQTVYLYDTASLESSQGQVEYTTPGTYTFIPGYTSSTYNLLAVGGGGGGAGSGDAPGGGGGGGLAYVNGYTMNSGTSYTVFVGAGGTGAYGTASSTPVAGSAGQNSYIVNTSTCRAGWGNGAPGSNGSAGGVNAGTVSGGSSRAAYSGGTGGIASTTDSTNWLTSDPNGSVDNVRDSGPGGGAGGYAGAGGTGGTTSSISASRGPALNSGGGAGGFAVSDGPAGGGGGVGIYGQGADGDPSGTDIWYNMVCWGGGGGSGGGAGGWSAGDGNAGAGGAYGGGGGGGEINVNGWNYGQGANGGNGACRIIWGSGRAYPSTNTADV